MFKKSAKTTTALLAAAVMLVSGSFSLGLNAFADSMEDCTTEIIYGYNAEDGIVETSDEQEFAGAVEADSEIQVVCQLDYEPYESDFREQITSDSTLDEVHALVAQFRSEQRAYYGAKNLEILQRAGINVNSADYDVEYSLYSPFVQIACDYEVYEQNKSVLVNSLLSTADVSSIEVCATVDLSTEATVTAEELSEDAESFSSLQTVSSESNTVLEIITSSNHYLIADALTDIGVSSNDTYKGNGIKVGFIEAEGVVTNATAQFGDMNSVNIVSKPDSAPYSDHAENVVRILCGDYGVAPQVSDAYVYYAPQYKEFTNALDWLLSQGCDVINASLGSNKNSTDEYGMYTYTSALFDYYVRYSYITIVVSAGNTGEILNGGLITPPGTGFNVITVANSTKNKNIFFESAYKFNSAYNMTKPNIAAPGANLKIANEEIGAGTSWSAPMVTGVTVKLMQQFPALISYPALVGAVIMASATRLNGQGDNWDTYGGAGLVNYVNAKAVLENNWFNAFNLSVPVTSYTKEFTQGTGSRIKMVANWFANTQSPGQYSSSKKFNNQYNIHTNYYLYLYAGTTLIKSSTGNTNIQYINTTIYANLSDNWSFKLQINGTKTHTDTGAVAWFYE